VIGRSKKSFLPVEKVAQSGFRSSVSGFGASVRLFKLRSDEHAPTASASAAIAVIRNAIPFLRCIAKARLYNGFERRRRLAGFCASITTVINRYLFLRLGCLPRVPALAVRIGDNCDDPRIPTETEKNAVKKAGRLRSINKNTLVSLLPCRRQICRCRQAARGLTEACIKSAQFRARP
jgi:hypothetical protein